MRHALRPIAIVTGFVTWCIVAATVAYAEGQPEPPLVGDQWWNDVTPAGDTGSPIWQLLGFVALGVFLAVAIVGLGYSLSHSQRSQLSSRSQTPLRS
jgi:hypothetical protein